MTYDEAIQTAKQRLRIWDGYGGNDTPESVIDQANGVAEAIRALLAGPPEPREPVAWRVKDFADGWILCHTEAQARREAEGCGNLVQPLYASPVPATEPSEEEVLAAWFDVEPARMKGPKHRSEVASVQRVQALYRSRRAT